MKQVQKQTKVVRPQFSASKKYQIDNDSSDEDPNVEMPGIEVYGQTAAALAQNKQAVHKTTTAKPGNDDYNTANSLLQSQ